MGHQDENISTNIVIEAPMLSDPTIRFNLRPTLVAIRSINGVTHRYMKLYDITKYRFVIKNIEAMANQQASLTMERKLYKCDVV